jgi:hypothetical protein
MFLAPWFAIAGLVAAAGPIVIHLLNRRRYKTVQWAAMDFLREAVFRSKRILQIRDLILLALRTACIILFGLAMARPFLAASAAVNPSQPVHAVLLMDNSLSMGYQKLDGTVLDQAKREARTLIEGLPRGSRMTVLPTCGLPTGASYDAYYTRQDALEALEAIKPVDRETKASETIELALNAVQRVAAPAQKQVVLFSDQQVTQWPVQQLSEHLDQVPGGIKVVEIASDPADVENAWVADFKVRGGVSGLEAPATFLATIAYEGAAARRDVAVALSVEGQVVQTLTVDLEPGQRRELEFAPYQFDVPAEPGKPYYAVAELSLPPDRLPIDDSRPLVVPVVATLPVVFVDQFGRAEDPRRNRYGETYDLRRLLTPAGSQAIGDKQLIKIDHRTIDEIEPTVLEDARLVVVAGVPFPGPAAGVLKQYVEQGGNLVIAAGGLFDPGLWTQDAWQNGRGVLPVPLQAVTRGRLPEESPGKVEYFKLDFNSLKDNDYFAIEGESDEYLRDLYALGYFFKAAEAVFDDDVRKQAVAGTLAELQSREKGLAEIDKRLTELGKADAGGSLSPAQRQQMAELEQQRGQIESNWLLWRGASQEDDAKLPLEQRAELSRPNVIARFDNGLPFMIERRIGHGRVLLITSGVFSGGESLWNTMSITDSVVAYDRVLRSMLQSTLPPRNISTERQVVIPIATADRGARFLLASPGGETQPLSPELIGIGQFGVRVRDCMLRGVYRLSALRGSGDNETPLWDVPLAFAGPAEESQLLSPTASELREKTGQGGQTVSLDTERALALGLERAQIGGTEWWKWFLVAVLGCLLAELLLLAWPSLSGERTS